MYYNIDKRIMRGVLDHVFCIADSYGCNEKYGISLCLRADWRQYIVLRESVLRILLFLLFFIFLFGLSVFEQIQIGI